jgi:hypothetical protein
MVQVKTLKENGSLKFLIQSMFRFGVFAAGLFAIILMPDAIAQAQGRVSAYAQATGANLRAPGVAHVYGGTFGLVYEVQRGPVLVGADARGAALYRGSSVGAYNDQAFDQGLLGLRVAYPLTAHGIPSLEPYAEAAIGLGYWRGGVSPHRTDSNHFLAQFIAGADYKVWRSVAWRIAEITYGSMGATPGQIHPITVSSGIVYRFN